MICPECGKSMLILEYRDIEVDYCPSCKGCWLDEGELELILGKYGDSIASWNPEGGTKGKRKCPRCAVKMHVIPMPEQGPDIDACPSGCGIWLDEGELSAVIHAHVPPGSASEMATVLAEIFDSKSDE